MSLLPLSWTVRGLIRQGCTSFSLVIELIFKGFLNLLKYDNIVISIRLDNVFALVLPLNCNKAP